MENNSEIVYMGEHFRSPLEARWAVFFDTLGVHYFYFPSVGFYLTDWGGHWVEIIESPTSEDSIRAQAKQSGKLVFRFSDCLPPEIKDVFNNGPDEAPDVIINNFGRYYAPDGDSDGMQTFGICPSCNMVTLGDKGGHWVFCNDKTYEIYQGSCKGWQSGPLEYKHPRILAAYTAARQARFEDGNIHSHKIKRPLIEQAITRTRHRVNTDNQSKLFYREIANALISLKDKYHWTKSAMAMSTYLLEARFNAVGWPPTTNIVHGLALPSHHIWIDLEYPVPQFQYDAQGLLLIDTTNNQVLNPYLCSRSEIERMAMAAGMRGPIDIAAIKTWSLVIFNTNGERIWNLYIAQFPGSDQLAWGHSDFHICCSPFHDDRSAYCHIENEEFVTCDICRKNATSWLSWIGFAHLMITGAFQEQEEAKSEEVIEKTIRKVPRSDKPHKFTEQQIEHRFRIIRFDASIRKVRKQREAQEPRGSWVEATLAIDPDAIVYVSRHIGKTERTFRHERFIHRRGQTIDVRAHDKRIPMKVSELGKKITHVVASKYDNS